MNALAQRPPLPVEINKAPVDRYTAGHFAVGFSLGLARFPWWAALLTTIAWELSENTLKRYVPRAFPAPTQDTLANSALDSVAFMAGWAATKLFGPVPTPITR
jgi:hypothetical protein